MNAVTERPLTADHAGTASSFLRYVHEHALGSAGRLVVSARQPPGSKSRYLSSSYRLDQIADAGQACLAISANEMNAYVRVHLIDRDLPARTKRGVGEWTSIVTHYAADVDIAGPGHKPAPGQVLAPDLRTAVELIDATLSPSCIISSGGGTYPVWRLSEPFTVTTDDDRRRVSDLGRRLDRALASHGYHVDATCTDLARIIRPPGVTNHKPERDPRPVTVLRGDTFGGGDYSLDQLERLLPALPTPPPVKAKPARTCTGSTRTAPWEILDERYDVDDILAADPVEQWTRVADQADGSGQMVPAWLRVGSSADYSIKAGSKGALIVWSSTLAGRLGIDPGGGISRWQLLCHFAGVDPRRAARWSA